LSIAAFTPGDISPAEFFSALPRKLLHLTFNAREWALDETLQMPPLLQTLCAVSCHFEEDSLESIPASVTKLTMSSIDDDIQELPHWPLLKELRINSMPFILPLVRSLAINSPKLETLFLSHSRSNITLESFAVQFPSLKNFYLREANLLGDEIWELLPNDLQQFKILSLARGLTAGGLALNIPRFHQLTHLQIEGRAFTSATLSILPISLLSLTVGIEHATDHQISLLPPSLTVLSMPGVGLTNLCGRFIPLCIRTWDLWKNKTITRGIMANLRPGLLRPVHAWSLQTSALSIVNGVVKRG
jgi:hypothetical protein